MEAPENGGSVTAAETLSGAHVPAATSESVAPHLLEPGTAAAASTSELVPAVVPAKMAKIFGAKGAPPPKRAKADKS